MSDLFYIPRKPHPLKVALASGILLSLGWIPIGFSPLLLIAFIPLLKWEDGILIEKSLRSGQKGNVFLWAFVAFAVFNLSRGWWVAEAAWFAILLPIFNASLMALTFTLYHYFRMAFRPTNRTMLFFPIFWLMFEGINMNWDFNFPWLNLGNGFADTPSLIQWYSITGASGGTLWICLTNVLCTILIIDIKRYGAWLARAFAAMAIMFVPIGISCIMYWNYEPDKSKPADIVLLQPNLDPYDEQYSLSADSVTSILLSMASKEVDEKTDYVIAPESCLQEYAWEERLSKVPSVERILQFNKDYPRLNWIAGMSTRRLLPPNVKTDAARYIQGTDSLFYECSNVALNIGQPDKPNNLYLRRKSYLTPTVEKMPYKKYMPFLESLALNLGGTVGTLATDSLLYCFYNNSTGIASGVMICYESVNGDIVRIFSLIGNEVLFCITNDGWWGDTQGYKQHKSMSRLRAIENRRYLCRAANTGISCFIDPRGNIMKESKYWERQTLKDTIYLQKGKTFYAKHGDYIYYLTLLIFFVTILMTALQDIKGKCGKRNRKRK
ncbi:MAG: apolipoprotein N-acyltransferase [Bacteroidales bacterium]|jgi:apolipoprotein N-acyltransferase|nr:apolipoprotein N-acyltransferase [Bacteroidales bacterium]